MTNYPYRDEEEGNPLHPTSPLIENDSESATLGEVEEISKKIGVIPRPTSYMVVFVLVLIVIFLVALVHWFGRYGL